MDNDDIAIQRLLSMKRRLENINNMTQSGPAYNIYRCIQDGPEQFLSRVPNAISIGSVIDADRSAYSDQPCYYRAEVVR